MSGAKPLFFVFRLSPFKKGDESEEVEKKYRDDLIYRYPPTVSLDYFDNLLGVIVSFYTFTSISLDEKLDFISFQEQKIALHYFERSSKTLTVFCLCGDSDIEENTLKSTLKQIMRGFFFILGEKGFDSYESLQDFLNLEGSRIFRMMCGFKQRPNETVFPYISTFDLHRSALPTALSELYLLRNDPRIWGVACFVNNKLLVTITPLEIVRLFLFSPFDAPQTNVYLTAADRKLICNDKNSTADVPNEEVITTTLLRLDHGDVVFYVIASPVINTDHFLLINIAQSLEKTKKQIVTTLSERHLPMPTGTMTYDREMLYYKSSIPEEANMNLVRYAHAIFTDDARPATDTLMYDAGQVLYGLNIYGVEHISVAPSVRDEEPQFQVTNVQKAHPSIDLYIRCTKNYR